MTTGYTAPICEGGDITFREFAMRCARATTYLAAMCDHGLDADIPAKIVPRDRHEKEITEAKAAIARLESMPGADADHAAAWEYEQVRRRMTDGLVAMNARRNRLQAMLVQVNDWTPPTGDHFILKQFMLDQLHEELRYCTGFSWPEPARLSGAAWKAERIAEARAALERGEANLAKERQRCDEANTWLSALRSSLPAAE